MASDAPAVKPLTVPEIDDALADYSARAAAARARSDDTDYGLCHRVIDDLIGQRSVALLEMQRALPSPVPGKAVRGRP
jgi:hypothetical protein